MAMALARPALPCTPAELLVATAVAVQAGDTKAQRLAALRAEDDERRRQPVLPAWSTAASGKSPRPGPGRTLTKLSVAAHRQRFAGALAADFSAHRSPRRPQSALATCSRGASGSGSASASSRGGCQGRGRALLREVEECCVCFAATASRTPCGHPICAVCVYRLKPPACCPVCRRALQERMGPTLTMSTANMVERIGLSSLSDLDVVVSQRWASCGREASDVEQLRAAVTARCSELVPTLALRGLEAHVVLLGRLQAAGLLASGKRDEQGAPGEAFGEVLEKSLVRALDARFLAQEEAATSLEALRPPAELFRRFRDLGLLASRGPGGGGGPVAAWLARRVSSAVERLSLDFTFPRRVAVAEELVALGAAGSGGEVERAVARRRAAFEGRSAAS